MWLNLCPQGVFFSIKIEDYLPVKNGKCILMLIGQRYHVKLNVEIL